MAGHFEAKKQAYRQTQDGIVISFVMHPDDVSQAIAMAPLGTRFMVGFAEIGDDERPVQTPVGRLEDEPPNAVTLSEAVDRAKMKAGWRSGSVTDPKKDKRRFADLPASQQAAIRCGEQQFREFLHGAYKQWFEQISVAQDITGEELAAELVRKICGVGSRAAINETNQVALERWFDLERRYQDWLANKQYAGSIRG